MRGTMQDELGWEWGRRGIARAAQSSDISASSEIPRLRRWTRDISMKADGAGRWSAPKKDGKPEMTCRLIADEGEGRGGTTCAVLVARKDRKTVRRRYRARAKIGKLAGEQLAKEPFQQRPLECSQVISRPRAPLRRVVPSDGLRKKNYFNTRSRVRRRRRPSL